MKFLVISDSVSSLLYGRLEEVGFEDINLVISCGDLPLDYLEYVISVLNVPCYFVPGNHDESYLDSPPPGWNSLDGRVVVHEGITLMGFGGSLKYKPNAGPLYYTEMGMQLRFLKLKPQLWFHNKIDILVTHAPAFQVNDLEGPHQGFKVFRKIIEQHGPKYHLHGHVHLNYSQNPRVIRLGETLIINGFQHHVFDY